jgi:molecular chaperone GrpE
MINRAPEPGWGLSVWARDEAVSTAPAVQPDEDGVVAVCFQVGYVINGHVLRPARVVVKQWTGA